MKSRLNFRNKIMQIARESTGKKIQRRGSKIMERITMIATGKKKLRKMQREMLAMHIIIYLDSIYDECF